MKIVRLFAAFLSAAMLIGCTACDNPTVSESISDAEETGDITLKISWWGGEARHNATQAAIAEFERLNPDINIETDYSAWTGWEEKMSTMFYAGTAPDINQINWNWITSYSSDGKMFLDLNTVSECLDLAQFDKSALEACTIANKLQAVPVSMTGRIFYWNKKTFSDAGTEIPKSYKELLEAGEIFRIKLGEDYYPLAVGEYDRMILMVYYLQSVYGKEWMTDNKLNFSFEEITEGFEFIKGLEDAHVIPSIRTLTGDGAYSLDKNHKWIEGKYAGIFEWESSAGKFRSALDDELRDSFVVGDFFGDFGGKNAKGGFSKISLAFAISENTKYPKTCAKLLNFMVNGEGAKLMSSERGVPLSKSGLQMCMENNLIDSLTLEANRKALDWAGFKLSSEFEDADLKTLGMGIYYTTQAELSYGRCTAEEAAQKLISGIEKVLG